MLRYFADHPTAANILMFAILIIGLTTLPSLNRETFPEVKAYKVQVTVAYPGASPKETELGLCNPLEDATDGISFLREQQCEALEGQAKLTLSMQEDGDMESFIDDAEAAVDAITEFPDDAEEPVVEELGRVATVCNIAIKSTLTQPELKALAELYRVQLLSDSDIPIVEVTGFSQHELNVQVSAHALRQYQLSIGDIANLIGSQSVDMPAGTLKSEHLNFQISVANERRSALELENLVVLVDEQGAQIKLGDVAKVVDRFKRLERRSELDGSPAAVLTVKKNKSDDVLTVFEAVQTFVETENAKLPPETRLLITRDSASVVEDRLSLLLKNSWQGLILATAALFLFFSWRYTFWVALGLPISFIGGFVLMQIFGISINMISMVALLMAIGILMDDAIVLSESIENEYAAGKPPLEAVVVGTKKVARGVLASFATSTILFGSLLFMKGDMGQVLGVLPVVLLSVLVVSLIEAFLILPHHLKHSLEAHHEQRRPNWRLRFEAKFEDLRLHMGYWSSRAVANRYLVVGGAIALFLVSVSLMPAGLLKFKAFPDLEGNVLEAKILMSQGTPFERTQGVVEDLLVSLQATLKELPEEEQGKLVESILVSYGSNTSAGEQGEHVATITLDLLDAEKRINSLHRLRSGWRDKSPVISDAIAIQYKEPVIGPAGQAIAIRLQSEDLEQLSGAAWELQNWIYGYPGVSNVLYDLRPGKPELAVKMQSGALSSGVTTQQLATQLRAAYFGTKVDDVYRGHEALEVNVNLLQERPDALSEFDRLPIFNNQGQSIPLISIAHIQETRGFSRINRYERRRTVTVTGDIDAKLANTGEVIGHVKTEFLPKLREKYPQLNIMFEGEVKNSRETSGSILTGFALGIIGVFLLLALQFRNYREPLVVLLNIPLALIGVIWGHLLMGLDMTLPSIIGFVSLAGVVVNDSILLVEFVKLRCREGMTIHAAASQAVKDRFRAIVLTSITTVAGMLPLLSETSMQAQVLVPLVASVVFGMVSSTLLIMFVLPAAYAILEDFGLTEVDLIGNKQKLTVPV